MSIGSIIGGAGNVIGTLLGNRARKKAVDKQFKLNKEMFDYQNAYNTPANQMKRLRDAGLNPALMYGQGNTGNAMDYAKASVADVESVGPSLAQSASAGAQLSLLNSQRQKLNAEALNTTQDAINKGAKGGNAMFQAILSDTQASAALKNSQNAGIIIDNEIKSKTKADQIKKVTEEVALIIANKNITNAKKGYEVYKSALAEKGINVTDNLIFRIISQLIGNQFPEFNIGGN